MLFVLLPCLSAYMSRVNLREGFCLTRPSLQTMVGGLVLGLTLWPLVVQLMFYLHAEVSDWLKEQADASILALRQAGYFFSATLAVAAVTEEFFFRGYLFTALARAMKPANVIVLTALLFGIMHGLIGGGIGFEQVLPATLIGLVWEQIRCAPAPSFPAWSSTWPTTSCYLSCCSTSRKARKTRCRSKLAVHWCLSGPHSGGYHCISAERKNRALMIGENVRMRYAFENSDVR